MMNDDPLLGTTSAEDRYPPSRFQDGGGDYDFGDDGNGDGDDSDDDSFQESPLQRGSIPSPKVFPAAL